MISAMLSSGLVRIAFALAEIAGNLHGVNDVLAASRRPTKDLYNDDRAIRGADGLCLVAMRGLGSSAPRHDGPHTVLRTWWCIVRTHGT